MTMKTLFRLSLLAALAGLMLAATGCQKLEARDQLNRGVANFKAAQFNAAIENFQKAIQLDPTLVNAKLYLAAAYQSQFTPGAPSMDNLRMAQLALDEYQVALNQQPDSANAIAGIARLNYDMGNLDAAKDYYTKSLSVNPKDPTAYYTLGAIAYQKTIKGITLARQSQGISDLSAPLITKKSPKEAKKNCQDMAQQDEATIDDGITQLKQAVTLRPGYADAMTYLNLLYREKGDLTCGNDAARTPLIDIANKYAADAIGARKAEQAEANAKASGGVTTGTPH